MPINSPYLHKAYGTSNFYRVDSIMHGEQIFSLQSLPMKVINVHYRWSKVNDIRNMRVSIWPIKRAENLGNLAESC